MPVHSNRQHQQNCVEDYFPLLSKRKDGPWLAHRLDQDTAGCLVIALRKQALIKAQACFAAHTVKKIYWAIVEGKPLATSGIINAPLIKHTHHHKWYMKHDLKGQSAMTKWKILGSNGKISCLELELLTGRTHQARAHCAFLGYPILGDSIYGSMHISTQLQLLSHHIELKLDPILCATAEPPDHMLPFLKACDL